jgi:hypothetical protein
MERKLTQQYETKLIHPKELEGKIRNKLDIYEILVSSSKFLSFLGGFYLPKIQYVPL